MSQACDVTPDNLALSRPTSNMLSYLLTYCELATVNAGIVLQILNTCHIYMQKLNISIEQ